MSKTNEKYQVIFYLTGFWFKKLKKEETSLALIYDWAIGLGFVEIRKWKKTGQKRWEKRDE